MRQDRRIADGEPYFEERGSGEPVLFIHGLGSSMRDWRPQMDFFSRTHRVISYDVRGHGGSPVPAEPYDMRALASDAARLLEQRGAAPAHVVGLSMGGAIAFQLLADRPDLIRSAVITNSAPELILRTVAQRGAILVRIAIVSTLGTRAMGTVLARRLFPGDGGAKLRRAFIDQVGSMGRKPYIYALRAMVGWSVADSLASMDRPVLILASDRDYSAVALKRAYAARMPRAEVVVVPNARHALPVERPDEFNAAVSRFLARNAGSPQSAA